MTKIINFFAFLFGFPETLPPYQENYYLVRDPKSDRDISVTREELKEMISNVDIEASSKMSLVADINKMFSNYENKTIRFYNGFVEVIFLEEGSLNIEVKIARNR